jgi:hypothetical protein
MLDVYASERHYIDHTANIWLRLSSSVRNKFIVRTPELAEYAKSWGVSAEVGLPADNLTLVASFGDYRRTSGPVIYMEHGIGHTYSNNHPSYAGGSGKDRVVLFLCQHELTAAKNQAAYPSVPVAIIGTPKLDAYKPRQAQGRTVAISFHWDCRVSPESRSAFMYYRGIIGQLNTAKDIKLIGHAHPKVSFNQTLQRYYKSLGVEYVHTFDEVLDRADLYVIDNSSTAYEFAAMGRLVLHLNAPSYRKDVSHGIRFWDYIPGPMVNQPREVLPKIRKMLDFPELFDDQRKDVVKKLYPYLGKATARAVKVIEDFLS